MFRVPPPLLFELSRATWSNSEQMARQFYDLTLKPWIAALQRAYSRVLLSPDERRDTYIEFNLESLLSADHATKATAYGQYCAMGALTANEVRAGLNVAPHPDGDKLDNPHITTPDNRSADDAA